MPSPAADPGSMSGAGYRELLIGCGTSRRKQMKALDESEEWCRLTTLDFNPDCNPDIEADLEKLPYDWASDNEYDEIHAYEVLEHTGQQGDFRFFFAQFMEFWRILKPGGLFVACCPHLDSPWLWTDPGHKRVIDARHLVFLSQAQYTKQCDQAKNAMTDYRRWFRGDFEAEPGERYQYNNPPGLKALFRHDESFYFVLRTIKPARIAA